MTHDMRIMGRHEQQYEVIIYILLSSKEKENSHIYSLLQRQEGRDMTNV